MTLYSYSVANHKYNNHNINNKKDIFANVQASRYYKCHCFCVQNSLEANYSKSSELTEIKQKLLGLCVILTITVIDVLYGRCLFMFSNDVYYVFRCLTCQLTTQELHAKSAVSPAHLWIDPHILSFDWRGKGVGKWSVVINIPTEDLYREMGEMFRS